MTAEEKWLPVKDWESLYEVSDAGQVRSIRRWTRSGMRGGEILTPWLRRDGYYEVQLFGHTSDLCTGCGRPIEQSGSKPGTRRKEKRRVHRLVLEAFVGPCPEGMEALHGPGGKLDNRLENLQWGTRERNMGEDRVRDKQSNRGEHHGQTTLTWAQVCEIRSLIGSVPQNVLATRYGVSKQTITNIKTGYTWKYPPEEW